eukprot:8233924-Pyramimonas_sp.AAC.1
MGAVRDVLQWSTAQRFMTVVVHQEMAKRGFTINYAPGETETLVLFTGKQIRTAKQQLAALPGQILDIEKYGIQLPITD